MWGAVLLTQGVLEITVLYESLCSKWQELCGSSELLLLMRQDSITQGTGSDHASVQSSGFCRVKTNNLLWCEAACSAVPVQTQRELGAVPMRSHPDKSVHRTDQKVGG